MERNFNIDYFERLLKEKSDEFRMYPNKRVWHSVYNNLHPGRRWPSVVMCITLISALLLVGYLNTNTAGLQTNSTVADRKNTTIEKLFSSVAILPLKPFTSYNNNDAEAAAKTTTATLQNHSETITFIAKNNNSNEVAAINHSTEKTFIQPFSKTGANNIITIAAENKSVNKNNDAVLENLLPPLLVAVETKSDNTNPAVTIFIPELLPNAGIIEENKTAFYSNSGVEITKAGLGQQLIGLVNTEDKFAQQNNTTAGTKEISQQVSMLTDAQKAWIENYALYNRPVPKNWNGKLSWQAYITPSVVYRKLYNNLKEKSLNRGIRTLNADDVNSQVTQVPSYGMEAGAGLQYSLFKWVKIKAGLQVNFTRYNSAAFEITHPIATTVTMIDPNSGLAYEVARATVYSNSYGINPAKLHNQTLQFSIPIGIDLRLAKYDNLEWYVASSIQPTFVVGGRSYLISSNGLNYIKETTFINRFNLNAGYETYITYKSNNGITWQFGPEYRTQLFGTNNKTYSIGERLVNYGFKFGVSKKL